MSQNDDHLTSTASMGIGRRIVLSIVSGARSNQVEEFPVDGVDEVVLGRDPDVHVKFDPDRDDLVSRRHAKLVPSSEQADAFDLVDLGSSNGTMLGGNRLIGQARLRPGDTFQLGAGGPKVVFDLEPRPPVAPPATRLAAEAMPPATRQAAVPAAPAAAVAAPAAAVPVERPAAGGKPSVGRETVERLVASSDRQSRQRSQLIGLGVAVLAVVAAVLFYLSRQESRENLAETDRKLAEVTADQPMTPAEIADLYSHSNVFIEKSWTLVHAKTGQEVYHRYTDGMPDYVLLTNGRAEPWLLDNSEFGRNVRIGTSGTASGFVVKEDGFILTNRHVAASWRSQYDLPLPGRLYEFDSDTEDVTYTRDLTEADRSLVHGWIPSEALAFGSKVSVGKVVEGHHQYLDVTFPKNTLRIPARVVRVSDTHDAALIKIDLPDSVQPVELFDNYNEIRAGETVTVIGYPAISPDVEVRVASLDAINRASEWRQVPDPTVSPGLIGRVIRGMSTPGEGDRANYRSEMGDVYQLTVDNAGFGNSGGPVFDDRGRVIGIFTYGRNTSAATVTFAVPIRYGIDLMKISPVLR